MKTKIKELFESDVTRAVDAPHAAFADLRIDAIRVVDELAHGQERRLWQCRHAEKLAQDAVVGVAVLVFGGRWITADTPAELKTFCDAYPMRLARDAANTLAYLCTSPYDVRLAQERFPKIHFHPLREHAGLALQTAG